MTAAIEPRPWNALPPSAAAVLQPELPDLAEEIIAAIRAGVPDYARSLGGPFGAALRVGVEEGLRQFTELVESETGERGEGREIYVNLGRGEMLAGRSLDALLAAYRLGARVAWRRLAGAGERAGLEPQVLYLLAESIFAYIDELSGESVEGYTREQAAAAGERQRLRRRLAGLLIQAVPADRAAVETAASAAGWALPNTLAAIVVEAEEPDRLAQRLGGDVIAARLGSGVCALVPDPDGPGRRGQVTAALSGRSAAIGPTVGWHRAGVSANRARRAFELAQEGLIAAVRDLPVEASEHPVELLLGADRALAADLAADALAPLMTESPASSERLRLTLEQWLRHRGRTERVAEALHVHPQTVRYRLNRLRELFGERLEDPDERFRLELAVRAGPPAPAE